MVLLGDARTRVAVVGRDRLLDRVDVRDPLAPDLAPAGAVRLHREAGARGQRLRRRGRAGGDVGGGLRGHGCGDGCGVGRRRGEGAQQSGDEPGDEHRGADLRHERPPGGRVGRSRRYARLSTLAPPHPPGSCPRPRSERMLSSMTTNQRVRPAEALRAARVPAARGAPGRGAALLRRAAGRPARRLAAAAGPGPRRPRAGAVRPRRAGLDAGRVVLGRPRRTRGHHPARERRRSRSTWYGRRPRSPAPAWSAPCSAAPRTRPGHDPRRRLGRGRRALRGPARAHGPPLPAAGPGRRRRPPARQARRPHRLERRPAHPPEDVLDLLDRAVSRTLVGACR